MQKKEMSEKVNPQIEAETLEEAMRKLIKQPNLAGKFKSAKTRDFKFSRKEEESR